MMAVKEVALPEFDGMTMEQRNWLIRLSSVLIIVTFWEIAGRLLGVVIVAPFSTVVSAYIELAQGPMYRLLAKTLTEAAIGFFLMVIFAVPVGLLMGRSGVFEKMFEPWVSAFFVTSASALLPVMIVLFGISFTFRMAILWFAGVWHVLLNVYHGAKGVDQEYLDVAQSFDMPRWKTFLKVTLPATGPFLMSGLRMGLARAIRGIILAETYIYVAYGGFIREFGRQSASTAGVLALILNLMIVAVVLRRLLLVAESRFFPWAEEREAV